MEDKELGGQDRDFSTECNDDIIFFFNHLIRLLMFSHSLTYFFVNNNVIVYTVCHFFGETNFLKNFQYNRVHTYIVRFFEFFENL